MLPIQRKHRLIEHLAKHGAATIATLSQIAGVSEMTIRRDLKLLEDEGIAQRSHGGALYLPTQEPPLVEKSEKNTEIKTELAAYAAQHFVSDGDVLILEGGTAVSRMAPLLEAFSSLTVLTNGLDTLSVLRRLASKHMVVGSGGELREPSGTFVGQNAQKFFESLHADTAFLSALGYTAEAGFTDPNLSDTHIKQCMIRSARRTVMLIDSSKFGQRYLTAVTAASGISAVVTDKGIPENMRMHLQEAGVAVHIV
ncbi:MAG: DeoR/GlpR transcriptional regulator [Paenibacillus sp.]|jgi:DeoR/GlpR family transcriptional regulator of sugar metabolism|nr:DeoR/GlpR transcriptional regulator [Paenibacillus sp.]